MVKNRMVKHGNEISVQSILSCNVQLFRYHILARPQICLQLAAREHTETENIQGRVIYKRV